jgi:hypothetical protein
MLSIIVDDLLLHLGSILDYLFKMDEIVFIEVDWV